ncbi:MAG: RNA 2',3'-cyclic phosphodiesterase [bacterium]
MNTRHRLFIAVNLAEKIKKELIVCQEEIAASFADCDPIRWTRKDNLHITLLYLGDSKTESLPEICRLTEETVKKQEAFALNLKKVCLDPNQKMVWAVGEENQILKATKSDLEKILLEKQNNNLNEENHPFFPHVTLGRINRWQWRGIDPEEMPQIEREISLDFSVDSIEIMESELKRGGPQYTILESIAL